MGATSRSRTYEYFVPATTPAAEVLALEPDGVFLSNGPGDPAGVAGVAAAEGAPARVAVAGVAAATATEFYPFFDPPDPLASGDDGFPMATSRKGGG